MAFAENLTSDVETVMAVNDFTPIEVKDLPAAVTEAIAKNFAESTVKEAAVEAAEEPDEGFCFLVRVKQAARMQTAAAMAKSTQSRVLVECFKNRPPK